VSSLNIIERAQRLLALLKSFLNGGGPAGGIEISSAMQRRLQNNPELKDNSPR
jgi:hypothetical protein